MKKRLLLIPLLLIGSFTLADEAFPDFPMTIYWDIKIWTTNLGWWTLKVYSSNTELTSFNITTAWKYGSNKATESHLLLNKFSWNLTFKVSYNWKIYVVDSIDDSNKWEWCPSKSSITFVSASCRYDITLKEDASSSSTPSNTWWWGWGGWWWGWGGWWWGWDTSKDKDKTKVNTWTNTTDVTKTEENKAQTDITENKDNVNTNTNNWTNTNADMSWYQEWNQSEVLSNWYSREFNNAYTFARRNWITTMDNISKADMNSPLNRIAMAKMLSNYAINVLGKKPANKVVPKFPDVDQKLNDDYGWAVDLAYQLGIMWIWVENFRPFDLVSRKEFVTAFGRMKYWLADWKWVYYEPHMKKLKEEWIITVDDPDLQETRWYTMIQLMRSSNK